MLAMTPEKMNPPPGRRFFFLVLLLVFSTQIFVWNRLSHAAVRSLQDRFPQDGQAQWQITANKLTYLEKESIYLAEGDVVVTREGQVLYAQKAMYNEQTGLIEVSGDVRFETNGDYLVGERAIFDLRTRTGQITSARLFMRENHFYVNGESMQRLGPDTYLVKGARLTSCDSQDPAPWSITASEVKVTVEGYGVIRNGFFKIRGVPVFYVPYGIFPAKTKRQSGLLPPGLGYTSRNGADMELPVFWAISDETDATFYERYMSERGLMQGVEWRYVAEKDSQGVFFFDILSDRIDEKDFGDTGQADISPFPRTNETRYWFRSKADQALPLGVDARLDTDYLSDQDYLREFSSVGWGYRGRPDLVHQFGRPSDDIFSPLRTSRLRLSRDQPSYSLQGYSSYFQRPQNSGFDPTPQPLGGAAYSLLPRPLFGEPLFLRLRSDYQYIWRDFGDKGQRVFLGPQITHPFWLGPNVEFEPSVGFTRTAQYFQRPDGTTDEQYRDSYDMQLRLSTLLERTFDFEWGETKRLKHKVFPSLIYSYRGYDDASKYRPWFEPTDAEGKRNVVAFSLENFIDAKNENAKGEVTYKEWGTLQLIQGYDITEDDVDDVFVPPRNDRPFLPLTAIFTYHPFQSMELDSEIWWDHYEDQVALVDSFLEFSLKRAGGRLDRYGLEYLYIRDGNQNQPLNVIQGLNVTQGLNSSGIANESLGVNAHVNVVDGIAAGTSVHRALNLDRSVGARYYLQYSSQCWGVQVSMENLAGIDAVMVKFSLLGLGEIGR